MNNELVSRSEERKVIFASSLGTVFEWYDFYLYATLAPFFAGLFFPKGNETAALLSAFATYAAGLVPTLFVAGSVEASSRVTVGMWRSLPAKLPSEPG